MSAHYAPLPSTHTDPHADHELEDAFDDSDDEDGTQQQQQQPPRLTRTRNGYHSLAHDEPDPLSLSDDDEPTAGPPPPDTPPTRTHVPRTYDFEDTDFDWVHPPPGSPPSPSAQAHPNDYGNSNGLVPAATDADRDARRGGWFRRTAATVLPSHYIQRWGLAEELPNGYVGGGMSNDGVFANVVAKPSRPVRVQEGGETYLVPEETQKDAPPSYATAQADAVPPYWETTVHAPSASSSPGEIIVDGLPTGSLFSFLWNMLVSISFQFVGFLLTYLLHTTHAAKLGSRAGLGITLIQYGFAMRRETTEGSGYQGSTTGDPWDRPHFSNAKEAEDFYHGMNSTMMSGSGSDVVPDVDNPFVVGDTASEWISFLLMTIGWFILLTSLLGFWRVKRWERGILNSQHDAPRPTGPANGALIHTFERVFGLHGLADGSLLRTGFGLGPRTRAPDDEDPLVHALEPVEEEEEPTSPRGEYIIPIDPDDPERNARMAQAMAVQARLHHDLRAAGLL
ncbi:uncharacterized protein LAESUDRAFT_639978 [Laetiporus sulphureus 93-53]|uniref:Metal homeostatis protein bsd2 n=1 Tax=Laetiporus sulphureus 93-53 TaxID=1314785 RepID=A0A165I9D0_9APHY|nr:uncharacterized protein LAESUDRAFT_639978 [Laetiporus sulphureus 93-53]KZT12763.1 hypothetical protein LAESUDRAFT_639978 [Laetiporus sulphureus 93-53]